MLDINKLEEARDSGMKINYTPLKSTKFSETVVQPQSTKKKYVTTWNYEEEKPQKVITSNKINTLVTDYNISRADVVHTIVNEAVKYQEPTEKVNYELLKDTKATSKDYKNVLFDYTNQIIRIKEEIQLDGVQDVDHKYLLQEIHHLERPLNQLTIEEVTKQWEAKYLVLQRQKILLENMINRSLLYGKNEIREIRVEDHIQINDLQSKINRLEEQLGEKDKQIDILQEQESKLEQKLEETQNNEVLLKGESELAEWKKKFSNLNRQFHDLQEELMMKQAEIDSLKNKKIVTKTVTQERRRSQFAQDSKLARQLTGKE